MRVAIWAWIMVCWQGLIVSAQAATAPLTIETKQTVMFADSDDDDDDGDDGDDDDDGDDGDSDSGSSSSRGSSSPDSSSGSSSRGNTGSSRSGQSGGNRVRGLDDDDDDDDLDDDWDEADTEFDEDDIDDLDDDSDDDDDKRGQKQSVKTKKNKYKVARQADKSLARYRYDRVVVTVKGCNTNVGQSSGMQKAVSTCLKGADIRLIEYRVSNISVSKGVKKMRRKKGVLSAQPDYLYQVAGRDFSAYGAKMTKLDKVPAQLTGKGIKVGLIDSLVDTRHKEFRRAKIKQHNLFGFKNKDKHATAISSILLSSKKIRGVAPNIHLVSIPAFYKDHKARRISSSTYLVKALNKMLTEKPDVLNLSFVGPKDELVKTMIKALQKDGTLVIAAAGNAGGHSKNIYPAAYRDVIGVTAIDAKKKLYKKATIGKHVDYAAPGVKLLTAAPKGRYGLVSGTSYASAYVTGLVALLKQNNSNNNVLRIMKKHAKDLGRRGKDSRYGYGLIKSPW